MRPSRKEACFGWRTPVLCVNDAAGIYAALSELLRQGFTNRIFADNGDERDVRAERGQIVRCIRSSAWHDPGFSVAQDQNWSLPRNPRNIAILKFVRNKIPEKHDSLGC